MKNEQGCKLNKLRKNDNIKIMTGKDKGKTGRILQIDRAKARVYIEGLNTVKKAMKKRKQDDKGGITDIEAPVSISNVRIMCKKCGVTRIGFKYNAEQKVRICKKCGEQL
jgi:large subunit ribosomal protein L24